MLPKLCVHCKKWFSCKSSLNCHTKTFHRPYDQVPTDKFPWHEKSGLKYESWSYDKNVQGEPEAAFVSGIPFPRQYGGLYSAGTSCDSFMVSLEMMMIPNQELITFPVIVVKLTSLSQKLILKVTTLCSTTEALTSNPKLYTILIN